MTPPSPLFPCTRLGRLPARPTRNSVPQANASPLSPGPRSSSRHPERSEGSLFSDAHVPLPRPEGTRPFTHSTCSSNTFFPSLPFRIQYIVLRHIPRTRPSGVTIYLSSRPNTGDH